MENIEYDPIIIIKYASKLVPDTCLFISSNELKPLPQCNGNNRTEYSSVASSYVTSVRSINSPGDAAGRRRYSSRFPAEKRKIELLYDK